MLLLCFTFAVLCWQLFLEAVVANFELCDTAADLRHHRKWTMGWMALIGAMFIPVFFWHNSGWGVAALVHVLFGAPIMYFWQIVVLRDAENQLRRKLAPARWPENLAGETDLPRDSGGA